MEEEQSRDEETEREMAPKKLQTRGEALVPEMSQEPTTEEAKSVIKPDKKE
jgi:hypothetical protein